MQNKYSRQLPDKGAHITIFVEGKTDAAIVKNILFALDQNVIPIVVVCDGKHNIAKRIKGLDNSGSEKYIALIDSDKPSVFDSRREAERQLGHPSIPVFCAVPTIEAWLFADNKIASNISSNEAASSIIKRMPLPESIPYPKYLASQLLRITKHTENYEFLKAIDIYTASARSPSLRDFIAGICELLELSSDFPSKSISSTVNRDIFATLLHELPSNTIAWKTLSGDTYSAAELAKGVGEGTDIGKQYMTELLRVARDILLRKAKK